MVIFLRFLEYLNRCEAEPLVRVGRGRKEEYAGVPHDIGEEADAAGEEETQPKISLSIAMRLRVREDARRWGVGVYQLMKLRKGQGGVMGSRRLGDGLFKGMVGHIRIVSEFKPVTKQIRIHKQLERRV